MVTVVTVAALSRWDQWLTLTVGTVAGLSRLHSVATVAALSLWGQWLQSHCCTSGCTVTVVTVAALYGGNSVSCYCGTSGCTLTVITVGGLAVVTGSALSLW